MTSFNQPSLSSGGTKSVIAILLLAALPTVAVFAQSEVFISEFLASNQDAGLDEDGDSSDWLEIYNAGNASVNLSGWYLSDRTDNLTKWSFPSIVIEPDVYLVVYASGKDRQNPEGELHTNFKMSAGGEYLGLIQPDGLTVADAYAPEFPPQYTDVSYGRMDPADPAEFMSEPTPGKPNWTGFLDFTPKPAADPGGGFYEQAVAVTLTANSPGDAIYYTLDNSNPGPENGSVYSAPIQLDQTVALRFVAIGEELEPSEIITQTYIFLDDVIRQSADGSPPPGFPASRSINNKNMVYGMDPDIVDSEEYSSFIKEALLDIPSLSIVTDPDNLFDQSTGIYVNPQGEGRDWERPGSLELLNPDGTPGFQVNAGLRIRGGATRTPNNPKNAFRFIFRNEYGTGNLRYPLFGDEGVDVFDKIDIRTAQGFAWQAGPDRASENTFLRDVLSRDSEGAMGNMYTRSRYYHLYLNGQYWGLYQTEERIDPDWAASYQDSDPLDYDSVKVDRGFIWQNNRWVGKVPFRIYAAEGEMDTWRLIWELARKSSSSEQLNSTSNQTNEESSKDTTIISDFEDGDLADGLSVNNASSSTMELVSDVPEGGGNNALRADVANAAQWFSVPVPIEESLPLDLSSGIRISFWIKSDVSGSFNFQVHTPNGNTEAYTFSHLGNEQWTRIDAPRAGFHVPSWSSGTANWSKVEEFRLTAFGQSSYTDQYVVLDEISVESGDPIIETEHEPLEKNENYFHLLGRNADGNRDPEKRVLVNVDNLINYMVLKLYSSDHDGPISFWMDFSMPNNSYSLYNRNADEGFFFVTHDNEFAYHVTGVPEYDNRNGDWTAGTDFETSNPHWLHNRMASNAEYRMAFADAAYRALQNDGALTVANNLARMRNRRNQIDLAMIAESARWGDTVRNQPYTKADWEAAVGRLEEFLLNRGEIVIEQLREVGLFPLNEPPEMLVIEGGTEGDPAVLSIENPNAGEEVFLTFDGSDPREIGGAINPYAITYSDPVAVPDLANRVRARIWNDGEWSVLMESPIPGASTPEDDEEKLGFWRTTHFDEADLIDPEKNASIWGDLADPDRDRLPNLIEYYMGLDPYDGNIGNVWLITVDSANSNTGTFTYRWSGTVDANLCRPEWTKDLSASPVIWSSENITLRQVSSLGGQVAIEMTVPIDPEDKAIFVRLTCE